MTTALEGSERSALGPGSSLPPGKTRYPLYRRLGGPQDRSGQVRKISPSPGFDPRTVQLVASRYTDYATRPISVLVSTENSERCPSYSVYASCSFHCKQKLFSYRELNYLFIIEMYCVILETGTES